MKRLGCIAYVLTCSLFFSATVNAEEYDIETVSVDAGRMNAFINAEAERLSDEAFARVDTREEIERDRMRLLREFLFMIGLEPLPERTPLHVTVTNTVEREGYTVEVLHYQSVPHFYVTANLYKPKTGTGPYPAVIWGPGHSPGEGGAKALRQLYAIPWVRAGYIVLVIDPIQVGEVYGVHRGTHSWDHYEWYSRGYSSISIEVWNAMRGVDYLLERPDVDPKRLTINGVSGGGHLSWMAGAADDRLTVVQPVAGTADVRAHVQLDLQRGHCDCAYFINAYRHDWTTLAALICPRPLYIQDSTEDAIYPPEGYNRVFGKVSRIYSAFGAEDKAGLFDMPGEHGYFKEQRENAVEWSDRWLKGIVSDIVEQPFEPIPGEELAAFRGDLPRDAINADIQELFIPEAKIESYTSRAAWEKKKAEIRRNLDTVVFRNMPSARKAVSKTDVGGSSFVLETEPGILVGVSAYIPRQGPEKRPALIYVASPGENLDSVWNYLRTYPFLNDITNRYVVYPRGIGTDIWDGFETRRFERCAMLLGRTVDEMRVYDILCMVEEVVSQPWFDGVLTVAGKGEQGIAAAYAAIIDERIGRVILHAPPLSHKTGPVFLNILRYTDIPQAMAMLAPRELAFLTWEIEHFGYTKDIYGLYDAGDMLWRGQTVTQVLNGGR